MADVAVTQGRLRREADSGLVKGWMALPVPKRNALFNVLVLASREPDSESFRTDWGRTPVPAGLVEAWVRAVSGREAVNAAWALVLPMLLNLEKRGVVPQSWCEDESGWLYGILELAMRGPKAFDPERGVPFAFFLTRRMAGNCLSRRRRERTLHMRNAPECEAVAPDDGDREEEDHLLLGLCPALRGRAGEAMAALEERERPRFSEDERREIRRVMFSSR